MEYVNHLDTLIRKSTFRIKEPYVDGFISPYGEFFPVNSHHHVEAALQIIKSFDTYIDKARYNIKWVNEQILSTNKAIELINRLKEFSDSWKGKYTFADFLNKQIDDLPNEVFYSVNNDDYDISIDKCNKYIDQCNNDIKTYQKTLDEAVSEVSKFEKANKNKGYDAAEYIIINHGYIAVENGYLIYRDVVRKQLEDIDCYLEKDDNGRCVICKLTEEEIIQKKNKMRDNCLSLVGYYQDHNHRFHCPSGFTRRDYIRWENECYKCGLDPNTLIY